MPCCKRLKAGGERDDRGWDGWMASLTQWTWIWVNSGSWRWTGRPGVLQSMGSQKLDMTEWLNWTDGPSVIERYQEPKVRWKERTTEGWTWQGAAVPNSSTESESHSVVPDSLWPHGLYSPWNSPGQNTGVDSCSLLQGIFQTQELNWGLLHCLVQNFVGLILAVMLVITHGVSHRHYGH